MNYAHVILAAIVGFAVGFLVALFLIRVPPPDDY